MKKKIKKKIQEKKVMKPKMYWFEYYIFEKVGTRIFNQRLK
jgi:hypothetical protein